MRNSLRHEVTRTGVCLCFGSDLDVRERHEQLVSPDPREGFSRIKSAGIHSSVKITIFHQVRGVLENNGHSIVFQLKERLDDNLVTAESPSSPTSSSHSTHHGPRNADFVNISGGPLSYSYSFQSIHLHFGRSDGIGSEHTISGLSFAGEVRAKESQAAKSL